MTIREVTAAYMSLKLIEKLETTSELKVHTLTFDVVDGIIQFIRNEFKFAEGFIGFNESSCNHNQLSLNYATEL